MGILYQRRRHGNQEATAFWRGRMWPLQRFELYRHGLRRTISNTLLGCIPLLPSLAFHRQPPAAPFRRPLPTRTGSASVWNPRMKNKADGCKRFGDRDSAPIISRCTHCPSQTKGHGDPSPRAMCASRPGVPCQPPVRPPFRVPPLDTAASARYR
jgi:hypothetical protein